MDFWALLGKISDIVTAITFGLAIILAVVGDAKKRSYILKVFAIATYIFGSISILISAGLFISNFEQPISSINVNWGEILFWFIFLALMSLIILLQALIYFAIYSFVLNKIKVPVKEDTLALMLGFNESISNINLLLSEPFEKQTQRDETLGKCLQTIQGMFDEERFGWSVMMPNLDNTKLEITAASDDISLNTITNFMPDIINSDNKLDFKEKSISSRVYKLGESIFASNVSKSYYYKPDNDKKHGNHTSLFCCPLFYDSKVIGILSVSGIQQGILFQELFRDQVEYVFAPILSLYISRT